MPTTGLIRNCLLTQFGLLKFPQSSDSNSKMDFTAIDFETANQRRDSACQLAAVVVQDGQIVDRQMWLIRPRPFYFNFRNIEVHGIQPERVAEQPEFGEIWPTIAPHVQATCLVAHNAPFDIGVLRECLISHNHRIPKLNFTCTRLIARAAWPGRQGSGREGYGLKSLADWLGIQFRHHDALEDSVACARILLAAAATVGATSLDDLETKLKLTRGVANATEYFGAKRATRVRPVKTPADLPALPTEPAIDIQRLFVRAEFLKKLAGKYVVFSGSFKSMSRENAEQLAKKLGASLQSHVTQQTDIVIVGEAAGRANVGNTLADHRYPVKLLDEAEFLGLVQHTNT
jgi:DNA polymerase III subunit epsilon